jgi:hypothetical protein
MSSKKTFLLGVLTGALSIIAIAVIAIVGKNVYENVQESSQAAYDEGQDDDKIVESTGVYAANGNPILTDADEKYKIEVIAPDGYTVGQDYESAYDTEFYNADQSIRIEYSIQNNMAEDMLSFYEFDKQYYETAEDGKYTNVSSTEVNTMEVNGYKVNYLSLSYTYNETENNTEYCAYVMLDDTTEFMCNISGKTGEVSEEMIKECFKAQLPVTQ